MVLNLHFYKLYSQSSSTVNNTSMFISSILHNNNMFLFDSFNSHVLKLMSKHTIGMNTHREE